MRKLSHIFFNASAAISALLCLATGALWVDGHYNQIGFVMVAENHVRFFETVRGGFQYTRVFTTSGSKFPEGPGPAPGWFFLPSQETVISSPRLGFGAAQLTRGDWNYAAKLFPAYFPLIVFAVVPIFWIRSYLRRRHRAADRLCTV